MDTISRSVIVGAVFVLSFLAFFHPTLEFSQDLGRHIKMGEIILQTHSVPKTNLLSYTYPDFPFINHHWLSEVVFFLTYENTGITGLILLASLLGGISFAFLALFTTKKHLGATLLATILYLHILATRTLVRPEIFSMLFLSLFVGILYRNRDHPSKWIFFLPFLEILWVNMHIYFPIGIALVGLFFLESIGRYVLKKLHINNSTLTHLVDIPNKETYKLFLVLLLCIVATGLNPNGIQAAIYPFTVFSNYGMSIVENTSLFFDFSYGFWTPWFNSFLLTSLALLILLFTFYKKMRLADWLISLLCIVLAVMMIRNFLLFVMVTFIPFTTLLGYVLVKIERKWHATVFIEYAVFIVCAILLFWYTVSITNFGVGIWPRAEKGVDFLLKNNIHGPIFNNFDIGSYLEYRLYPTERAFVDGRPEAFPTAFFRNIYIPMQMNPALFDKEDQKYHFNVIFFAHTDITPWGRSFIQTIGKNPQWRLAYIDDTVFIFVKNIPANEKLFLSENDFLSGKIQLPNDEISLERMEAVIDSLRWDYGQIRIMQKILAINPHSCFALASLSQIFTSKKDAAAQLYSSLLNQYCR